MPLRDDGGDAHKEVDWPIPSAEITIRHGLGKRPAVTVMDTTGREVLVEVEYVNLNTVTIRVNGAMSGKVIFN